MVCKTKIASRNSAIPLTITIARSSTGDRDVAHGWLCRKLKTEDDVANDIRQKIYGGHIAAIRPEATWVIIDSHSKPSFRSRRAFVTASVCWRCRPLESKRVLDA